MDNNPKTEFNKTLEVLRSEIFETDKEIIELLAKRFNFVRKVGQIKKENNIPPLDQTQWNKVLKTRKSVARELNLNENLIENVLELIHKESLRLEK